MQNDTLLNIVFVCGLALIILGLIAAMNGMYESSAIAASGGIVSLFYCFFRA